MGSWLLCRSSKILRKTPHFAEHSGEISSHLGGEGVFPEWAEFEGASAAMSRAKTARARDSGVERQRRVTLRFCDKAEDQSMAGSQFGLRF